MSVPSQVDNLFLVPTPRASHWFAIALYDRGVAVAVEPATCPATSSACHQNAYMLVAVIITCMPKQEHERGQADRYCTDSNSFPTLTIWDNALRALPSSTIRAKWSLVLSLIASSSMDGLGKESCVTKTYVLLLNRQRQLNARKRRLKLTYNTIFRRTMTSKFHGCTNLIKRTLGIRHHLNPVQLSNRLYSKQKSIIWCECL